MLAEYSEYEYNIIPKYARDKCGWNTKLSELFVGRCFSIHCANYSIGMKKKCCVINEYIHRMPIKLTLTIIKTTIHHI